MRRAVERVGKEKTPAAVAIIEGSAYSQTPKIRQYNTYRGGGTSKERGLFPHIVDVAT